MSKLAFAFSSFGLSLAVMATPASATAADDEMQNVANALMARNYINAEEQIAELSKKGGADGAMLINLGNAYAGMGRRADAELAYKAALQTDPEMELDLADGSVRSVRQVAADGLRNLGVSYAGR